MLTCAMKVSSSFSPWTDIRVICPLLASGVSVLVLVTAYATKLQRRATKPIPVPSVDRNILVWNVTKAAATLVLLSLTVFTAFVFGLDASTTVNASLGFATIYAAILTLSAVLHTNNGGLGTTKTHSTLVLLSLLVPHLLRNIWPLLTFSLHPQDAGEGVLLWIKIGLLVFAGILVPLLQPFHYVPIDASAPQDVSNLNPEQTASIASRLLYTFLTPTVKRGNVLKKVTYEDLPPLADADSLSSLIKFGFPHLDPFHANYKDSNTTSNLKPGQIKSRSKSKSKTSLFRGLLRHFKSALALQALIILFHGPFRLLISIGTNRLLAYLESAHTDESTLATESTSIVRPWVWIAVTALGGAFLPSVTNNAYFYLANVTLNRVQALLTALIFDHALRVRVVASPSQGKEEQEEQKPVDGHSGQDGTPNDDDSALTPTAASTPGAISSTASGTNSNSNISNPTAHVGLSGLITDLATSDLQNILGGNQFLLIFLDAPLETLLTVGFLYSVLGWSAFAGLAVLLLLLPLPAYLSSRMAAAQGRKMKCTDARVGRLGEALGALRMLKLGGAGYTDAVRREIAEAREEELKEEWRVKLVDAVNNIVSFAIPLAHMVTSFALYTLVMKKELTASVVFSSMIAFSEIQGKILMTARMMPNIVRAWISLKRVDDFLHNTELLDRFDSAPASAAATSSVITSTTTNSVPAATTSTYSSSNQFGISNMSFAFSAHHAHSNTSSLTGGGARTVHGSFKLTVDHDLVFPQGETTLIVGPTGSGKTALLLALLGELHATPLDNGHQLGDGNGHATSSTTKASVHLPRSGGIAYAAQDGWITNATVRENIIFGASFPFSLTRYTAVLHACALNPDLARLPAGDDTEIGERGTTLSGGQRARITLARAVYSEARTVLLDDVLAALDVHTGRWIVEKCLRGDLMKERTVVMVTHNVPLAGRVAKNVVKVGSDGRVGRVEALENLKEELSGAGSGSGEMKDEYESGRKVLDFDVVEENVLGPGTDKDIDADADKVDIHLKVPSGTLVQEEIVAEGRVSWASWKLLISALGRRWPVLFFLLAASGPTLREIGSAASVWWIGAWAQQYLKVPSSEVNVVYYLAGYTAITAVVLGCVVYGRMVWTYGTIRASREIHDQFVGSLMRTTFRWLDTTPSSRILARATGDVQAVDGAVPQHMNWVFDIAISMVTYLGSICIVAPQALVPGVLVAVSGAMVGQVYVKAMLGIRREMGVVKAPVLAVFSSAISGLVSIRAYEFEERMQGESILRTDRYTRVARTFNTVEVWAGVRMDAIGTLFIFGLTTYLVYGSVNINPSQVGFSLEMAFGFARLILYLVIEVNETQIAANSLERLHDYINAPQELPPTKRGNPPAYWPSSGDLRVEKLTARYSEDGPTVLKDVSFLVKSGERVGIVGRTGSGKSTMTLALLRAVLTEGDVYYDGVRTASINIDALRAQITIIPQSPELLSGTLRRNLDIFGEHDDAILNDILQAVGLSHSQLTKEHALNLDSVITTGGANLSAGQRQLVALGRAMVRRSKLLIMDEATSAIDHETDELIQKSLRTQVDKDVTVLIVAHRLQTVIDADKILVLDAGRLVEMGAPRDLLKHHGGFFRQLVDESADKDVLYTLVR